MTGIPYELYSRFAREANVVLPPVGEFATGMIFVRSDLTTPAKVMHTFQSFAEECGLTILFWRMANVNKDVIGHVAKSREPAIVQVFVVPKSEEASEHSITKLRSQGMFTTKQLWSYYSDLQDPDYATHFAMVHNRFSTNTLPTWGRAHPQRMIAHNGEINTLRVSEIGCDWSVDDDGGGGGGDVGGQFGVTISFWRITHIPLIIPYDPITYASILLQQPSSNPRESSTELAVRRWPQQGRKDRLCYIAYVQNENRRNPLPGGQGNVNYSRARQSLMKSKLFPDELLRNKLFPIIEAEMSDSGSLDNMLEFLYHTGTYSLPEVVIMLIPEAWHNMDPTKGDVPQAKWDFFKWAACSFEPWDGPALVVFCDGRYIGAVLDRNGLRPARFYATSDDMVYLASEVGVIDVPDNVQIVQKGRLKAGRLVIVDTEVGELLDDEKLKHKIATSNPYGEWLTNGNREIACNNIRRDVSP
ncbi:unnamed protein product [Echinostoma caproni]|uniref:glutamate synthase (ferredoxin) n=1 Tax=Echinostoma caproni TaxID=27848 RepID=A0A183AIE9_9TREM|nr:unnamed protein product [Echinostoma caproni]